MALFMTKVLMFPSNCPSCNAPCQVNMKVVDIPHFKEVVIMVSICDACGLKDTEVKGGAGIAAKGRKITLKLTGVKDLTRDVVRSDMCGLSIPELDFVTTMSGSPGKFTTVEGLIDDLINKLGTNNPFVRGDSGQTDNVIKIEEFCTKLEQIKNGDLMGVHIVLDDPTGNSYLQSPYEPDPDPNMTVEDYERTFEQNEELGLNDMKTENYENQQS